MEKNTKIFILISICLISVSLFSYTGTDIENDTYIHSEFSPKKDASSPDTANVSVDNSPTEKYILKYNTSDDSIILITRKENGTEFLSSVDSINPYYLTKEDIDTLKLGIEVYSREDMFKLIEDFSS